MFGMIQKLKKGWRSNYRQTHEPSSGFGSTNPNTQNLLRGKTMKKTIIFVMVVIAIIIANLFGYKLGYQKAIEDNRIVVTINYKDFNKFVKARKPGIIGIPSQLTNADIDALLTKFVRLNKVEDCIGKGINI